MLLEAAHRLYSYDKVPFALALVHEVLEQHPDHANARKLYQMFTGGYLPLSVNSNYRLSYQFEGEDVIFIVEDAVSKKKRVFKTLEEADAFMRGNG